MSRNNPINRVLAIGFQEIERALDHAANLQTDGFPPFDITTTVDQTTCEEVIVISLAVAGFSADLLEITSEGEKLTITGKKGPKDTGEFLHQGIAMRQFERRFILAEGLEITTATLKNGMLNIELRKPKPNTEAKKIPIAIA